MDIAKTALRVNTPIGIKFGALLMGIQREQAEQKKIWIEKLRNKRVIASHPNDGWVDRDNQIFSLAYPHFQDQALMVGDKVALGFVPGVSKPTPWEKFMLVEVTEIIPSRVGDERYHYKILLDKIEL